MIPVRFYSRFFSLLFVLLVLNACRHPLVIVGEGDIVEEISGQRGCTLEEFRADAPRCAENRVVGEDYVVRYKPVPRPGYEFVGWEGTGCAKTSVFPYCEFNVKRSAVDQSNAKNPNAQVPATVAVFRSTTVGQLTLTRVRDITVHQSDTEFASLAKFSRTLVSNDVQLIAYAMVTNGSRTWMRVHDFTDPEDDLRSRELYGVYAADESTLPAYDSKIFMHRYPGLWMYYYNADGESFYRAFSSYNAMANDGGGDPITELIVSGGAPFIGSFEVFNKTYVVEGPWSVLFPPATFYRIREYDPSTTGSAIDIADIHSGSGSNLRWDITGGAGDPTSRRWINLEEGHAVLVSGNVLHFLDLRNPRQPEIYRQTKLSDNPYESINDIEVVRYQGIGGIEDKAIIATTDYATYMTYYTFFDPMREPADSGYASLVIDQPGNYIDVVDGGTPGVRLIMYIGDDIDLGDIYRYELVWDNDAGRDEWFKTHEARSTFAGGPRVLFNNWMVFQTDSGYTIYRVTRN